MVSNYELRRFGGAEEMSYEGGPQIFLHNSQ